MNSIKISTTSNKIEKIEIDLQNWNIPNEHIKKVYKIGTMILLNIIILRFLGLLFLLIKIFTLLDYLLQMI